MHVCIRVAVQDYFLKSRKKALTDPCCITSCTAFSDILRLVHVLRKRAAKLCSNCNPSIQNYLPIILLLEFPLHFHFQFPLQPKIRCVSLAMHLSQFLVLVCFKCVIDAGLKITLLVGALSASGYMYTDV